MIEKHQQANGIGRGKITINPEYIKRAGEITVGGLPIKVLSSNPNTGRVLAQFPDGHIEEVKAAPDYFIGGNTSTKELKNNLPVYGETNTAANERADSLDEAHDLTPIFSNLITAGQISTMNEGALDLLNGKYLEGTTKLFSPAMFGSGIGGVAARSVIGGYNLFNKNGVRKTYNLFNLGHYGEGALSLLGDAFNVAMATEGLGSISNALKGTSGYRNWRLAREINLATKNKPNIEVPKAETRTRVGDVEIDNPNLLYHLDRGDGTGAFSNQGAYVENGFLFPGVAKKEGLLGYSWWNKGKPYATSIKGQPMTRLITTAKDTPGMLLVRSQNYPIGQWTGSKGFVLPSEYVNSEGVNVSGSIYNWKPGYGYKKIVQEPSTSLAFFERKPSRISEAERLGVPKGERNLPFKAKVPKITAENAASITPEQWTAAQDAAIARRDMEEAQRLRDLHFNVNAPEADVPDMYHGTHHENLGNSIYIGNAFRDNSNSNINFYTSPSRRYAREYGPNIFKFKVNAKTKDLKEGRFAYLPKHTVEELKAAGYKGTVDYESGPMLGGGLDAYEYTFFNPKQYKLADAVTFDDNGVRIPLGKRDNFDFGVNDIRYGLLPFGIGLTGYGLYKKKQGGKMNILEFLKNGSGIHIKPENKDKFTKYCHGKVTSECIARGKRSSDPTVRKRATFALNVRRWKHEEGGKAFINGVNVLDSNPTAYKYVKKKYKMALEGTKLTFGLKVSNIGKNVGNWINNNLGIVNTAVNGITGLISANKKSKAADQFAKAKEAEMKSFKDKTWKEKYMENLLAQEDRSDVVNMSRAYNQTYGDVAQAVQEKLLKIDSQIAAAQLKAAQARGNAWGGILKEAGEIAMNALASNGIPKSKTNPTSLTGLKTSSFGGISTPQLTSPQTNYSFLK